MEEKTQQISPPTLVRVAGPSTLFGLFEEVADADTKQTAKLEEME